MIDYLSILLRFEGDEGESPGSSSLIVQNNQHLLEGAETRKFLLQFPMEKLRTKGNFPPRPFFNRQEQLKASLDMTLIQERLEDLNADSKM